MKCPHCKKTDRNEHGHQARHNTMNYGGGWFIFQCDLCDKKYRVWFSRRAVASKPEKVSDETELSF